MNDHSVEIRRHEVAATVSRVTIEPLPPAMSTAGSVDPTTTRAITTTRLEGIAPVKQAAAISRPFGTTAKRCSGGGGADSCTP